MRSTSLLFRSAITAALAGFLFGFDTVVISGAERSIQKLWELSDWQHGLAVSAALWGTVLGSLVGGWPTDHWGRTKTLQAVGVLYLVSAVWSGLATDAYSFMIARWIGGVGVGIATVAAPLYIAEISPPTLRGRLAGMFQFNIVFGILIAFASNAIIGAIGGEHAWRWMLGIEAVPAIIYWVMCMGIPESPRWLIAKRGETEKALEVLRRVNPEASEQELQHVVDEIAMSARGEVVVPELSSAVDGPLSRHTVAESANPYRASAQAAASEVPSEGFWTSRLRIPILLAFLIAFFNQLSGINAILYFAPRIFERAGLGENAALLNSVGIGITNLIFTFVGLWLIDSLGRRTLLAIGGVGYVVSLGLCSWAFFTETFSIVPACIFAFIAAHAVGQGAVIWVFISEIFPVQHRAAGQALGSFTHWIFAAALTLVFPRVVTEFEPGYVFGFFCFMMVLELVWIATMVPETKNVPLEEMEAKLGMV
ncbi:MFS transporter [Aeoliella sp. SH292]|uniref:MFS transporter n=1 Tax=Aeoliella sp. SH292 TaxID=3454464 RepID=UPI003F9B9B3B